jgi:NAD(P)-dependent dehydrogenase (short-subunit alcohol dehydrogenase family)|tara:strand:- start:8213 stop:8986 length:774 start_codon:yes stop_codon:yes gene_type:complete
MQIDGCIALVTGANRGIGLGFVRQLLKQGAKRVYVASRSIADANEIVKEAPDKLIALELDVTQPSQVTLATQRCTDVNLLINNAGVYLGETLMEAETMAAMRLEMEVNYFGVVAMCRAFAPILKQNGGGAIGNINSAGGIISSPIMGGYSPSKFASRSATACIRAELEPSGILVTALIVGAVDTRMAAAVIGAKAKPEDIAQQGLFAIKNNIDEWDTDPMAINVRAKLALDPKAMEAMMKKRLESGVLNTAESTKIY